MSKKYHTLAVGLFTLASLALILTVIILLGSSRLFSRGDYFILYFNESVNGLDVGSPVKFKGVTIGSVHSILIDPHPDSSANLIPVIVEVDPNRLVGIDGRRLDLSDPKVLEQQISFGLRGRLQQLSFITGMIYVELDYVRGRMGPSVLHHHVDVPMLEIPTVPSALAEVSEVLISLRDGLSKIDFDAIQRNMTEILDNLNKNLAGDRIGKAFADISSAVEDFRNLIGRKSVTEFVDELAPTLEILRQLGEDLHKEVGPTAESMRQLASGVEAFLERASQSLAEIEQATHPESDLRVEMRQTLRSLDQAARAMAFFMEFLERNPDALLRGRTD